MVPAAPTLCWLPLICDAAAAAEGWPRSKLQLSPAQAIPLPLHFSGAARLQAVTAMTLGASTRTSACPCMAAQPLTFAGAADLVREHTPESLGMLLSQLMQQLSAPDGRSALGDQLPTESYSLPVPPVIQDTGSLSRVLHLADSELSPSKEASEGACDAFSEVVTALRTGAGSFLVRFRLPGSFGLGL